MIKAIDTTYQGYRFRSRLEARVAVFLDAVEASWEYEKEGYVLPVNGKYLPDFYVTSFRKCDKPFWLEVKATKPSTTEINKLRELCVLTRTAGAFFVGSTTRNKQQVSVFSVMAKHDEDYLGWHIPEAFTYLQAPIDTYIEDASAPKNFWGMYGKDMVACYDMFMNCADCRNLKNAAKAALSARFEFGESG